MIDFLFLFPLLLLNTLWIAGIYVACQYEVTTEKKISQEPGTGAWITRDIKYFKDKMLLWWVRYYTRHWPWYVKKPLYDCMACMASIHGTIFVIIFLPFTLKTLIILPFYLGALAGLNQLIANKFNL